MERSLDKAPVQGEDQQSAERQFFGGKTLDESAADENKRDQKAEEAAERKFFGGSTLEEDAALDKVRGTKEQKMMQENEKAARKEEILKQIDDIIENADDNDPRLKRAIEARNRMNEPGIVQNSTGQNESMFSKAGRWFKGLFSSKEVNAPTKEKSGVKLTEYDQTKNERHAWSQTRKEFQNLDFQKRSRLAEEFRKYDQELVRLQKFIDENPGHRAIPAYQKRLDVRLQELMRAAGDTTGTEKTDQLAAK